MRVRSSDGDSATTRIDCPSLGACLEVCNAPREQPEGGSASTSTRTSAASASSSSSSSVGDKRKTAGNGAASEHGHAQEHGHGHERSVVTIVLRDLGDARTHALLERAVAAAVQAT